MLVGAILVVSIFLWPRRGLLWRWLRYRRRMRQIAVEDALKHIYDSQWRGTPATTASLAGTLGVPGRIAAELVARMQTAGLVQVTAGTVRLTPEGQAWALQVVRAHRLSERYLADELGVPLRELHRIAEGREHDLSPADADALDAQLGYPRFDPHGDPIPSPHHAPERPAPVSLTEWPVGPPARIVHVEDEPPEIFTQILSEGMLPDTAVEVLASDGRGLHLRVDGHECWLPPIVAAGISVEAKRPEVAVDLLSALRPGEQGTVVSLKCTGLARRRLMDLGLVAGTSVKAVLRGALGSPTAYRVRETLIALRPEQASQILVRRSETEAGAGQ